MSIKSHMTREQNSNCVLSDEDIKKIRLYYKEGVSRKELRTLFGVGKCTIYYWTVSDEKRKEIITKRNQYYKYNSKYRISSRISARKRRKLYPIETKKLFNLRHKKWLLQHPDYQKSYLKQYRLKQKKLSTCVSPLL